jgi:regulator of sigma E protease
MPSLLEGAILTTMFVLLAILALGLLIIVHEGGHYLVARWSKMHVERFSIGFGPGLLKWKNKRGTTFQIAPVPFGGFVHITGMNPHEEYDENDPHVYPNRPTYQRFLTILAGPLTNILFSTVFMFIVFAFAGEQRVTGYSVNKLTDESPAVGLLQAEDKLLKVDGKPVNADVANSFRSLVQEAKGNPVDITVLRVGQEVTVRVQPKEKDGVYLVGIEMGVVITRQEVGVGKATTLSLAYPFVMSKRIVEGFISMFKGDIEPELTGPVGITKIIKDQIKAGWVRAFEFLAMLNVYLGLFNLFPFPGLDGARLGFLGYELATRRRPNPKIEAAVHMVGFLILFGVLIVVTIKEIFLS